MSSSAHVRLSLGSAVQRLARWPRLTVMLLLALASWLLVAVMVAGIASLF